jgi:Winged helix DNA-binding domain
MTDDDLDQVIHAPARLRIVVTLAALRDGDNLSFTRLQELIGLTPGNLITHLRKLEDAGYLNSETTGNARASHTSIALTSGPGRARHLHPRAPRPTRRAVARAHRLPFDFDNHSTNPSRSTSGSPAAHRPRPDSASCSQTPPGVALGQVDVGPCRSDTLSMRARS